SDSERCGECDLRGSATQAFELCPTLGAPRRVSQDGITLARLEGIERHRVQRGESFVMTQFAFRHSYLPYPCSSRVIAQKRQSIAQLLHRESHPRFDRPQRLIRLFGNLGLSESSKVCQLQRFSLLRRQLVHRRHHHSLSLRVLGIKQWIALR